MSVEEEISAIQAEIKRFIGEALIEDLKDFKSLIVPLFFVPLGKLKDREWFTMEQMNDLQMELLIKCLKHDIYWSKAIMKSYFKGWSGRIFSILYWLFVKIIERKVKRSITLPPRLKPAKWRRKCEDMLDFSPIQFSC